MLPENYMNNPNLHDMLPENYMNNSNWHDMLPENHMNNPNQERLYNIEDVDTYDNDNSLAESSRHTQNYKEELFLKRECAWNPKEFTNVAVTKRLHLDDNPVENGR
ncbi:4935_t:CDS:2 [Racocetra fulgida]|uniref:4935_t:CDS:1 n=1 Tax=Racocetra fulgida TaxID=60492 RepID=A0A9N9GP41_9GLOM|nr:4935_t:CDS:2 [Racocetra fulgida]